MRLFFSAVVFFFLVNTPCFADYNSGVAAYNNGDFDFAVKEWTRIAQQKPAGFVTSDFQWKLSSANNRVDAQYALGLLYFQGKGVKQDYGQAEKWLRQAASSGHDDATIKLAYIYFEGLNGKADAVEGAKWLKLSADKGNVDAQYNLGVVYLNGARVIKPDRELARKWLQLAASSGDKDAARTLATMSAHPINSASSSNESADNSNSSVAVPVQKTPEQQKNPVDAFMHTIQNEKPDNNTITSDAPHTTDLPKEYRQINRPKTSVTTVSTNNNQAIPKPVTSNAVARDLPKVSVTEKTNKP